MINLDFSSVPSREPLEEGVYELSVSAVEEKNSSAGNPMISVTYDVTNIDGNRKLWDNFVLTEKSLWKLQEFFKALGLPTEEVVTMDVSELVGACVNAKVIQELYQGDTVNRIKKYLPMA